MLGLGLLLPGTSATRTLLEVTEPINAEPAHDHPPTPTHSWIKPLALAAALLGAASSAWTASVSLTPGAIGTGTDEDADGSFESATYGRSGKTGLDDVRRSKPEYRFAFEFNLTSLPAGAVIQAASLSVQATSDRNRLGQTLLSGHAGDGRIDLLQDMTGGAPLLSFTPSVLLQPPLDVSIFVQGVVGSGQSWAGFNMRKSPLVPGFGLWDAPQLTIEYAFAAVPEPQAYLMMLLGLGVMAGVARKRRAASAA